MGPFERDDNTSHSCDIEGMSLPINAAVGAKNVVEEYNNEPVLLGVKAGLEAVFRDPSSRPSLRTWNSWRAKGYYPYHKIGSRVFVDPVAVRRALDARFQINVHH